MSKTNINMISPATLSVLLFDKINDHNVCHHQQTDKKNELIIAIKNQITQHLNVKEFLKSCAQ